MGRIKPFQYLPFGDAANNIRLVELKPGEPDETIECHLKHVNIDKPGDYEALSYTWGDEPHTHSIKLNNNVLSISRNLWTALKQIRSRSSTRTLWIDAICINQQDIPERNAQVQRMGSIYKGAKQVLVWLGDEQDGSDYAMDPRGMKFSGIVTTSQWARMVAPRWEAFSRITMRSWWKRVWIIQEVAVAKKVLVLCGKKSIKWEELMGNLIIFDNTLRALGPEDAPVALPHGMFQIFQLGDHRAALQESRQSPDLLELLHKYRDSLSTDPRDKAFALLELANEESKTGFLVDYSLPLATAFTRLAQHIITKTRSFNILAFAWSPEKSADIPSWVPDWSKVVNVPSPLRKPWRTKSSQRLYSASRDLDPQFEFATDSRTLTTLAYVVETVLWTYPQHKPGIVKQFRRELDSRILRTIGPPWGIHLNEDLAREAVRRTWLLDTLKGSRITKNDFQRFTAWYERDGPKPKSTNGGDNITIRECRDANEYFHGVSSLLAEGVRRNKQGCHGNFGEGRVSGFIDPEEPEDIEFHDHMWYSEIGRVPFITSHCIFGLGPKNVKQGDVLCVAIGAEVPWLIRSIDMSTYEFVGECYVHGIMDGLILDFKESDSWIKRIHLR